MKYVKVILKNAEKIRKNLLKKEIFSKDYKIFRDKRS